MIDIGQPSRSELGLLLGSRQEIVKVLYSIVVEERVLGETIEKNVGTGTLFIPRIFGPRITALVIPDLGLIQPFLLSSSGVKPGCVPCKFVLITSGWVPEGCPFKSILTYLEFLGPWDIHTISILPPFLTQFGTEILY